MIFNEAENILIGDNGIKEAYVGDTLVWPMGKYYIGEFYPAITIIPGSDITELVETMYSSNKEINSFEMSGDAKQLIFVCPKNKTITRLNDTHFNMFIDLQTYTTKFTCFVNGKEVNVISFMSRNTIYKTAYEIKY